VTTVAVALEGAAPERLDALTLGLDGADLATDPDGAPLDPTIVMLGATAVLLYAVVPHADADAVVVEVVAGGTWRLGGVLGWSDDVATTARLLADRGLRRIAGRVLATTGAGCTVRWRPAKATKRRSPGRTAPR
jgi:hypothetical protein